MRATEGPNPLAPVRPLPSGDIFNGDIGPLTGTREMSYMVVVPMERTERRVMWERGRGDLREVLSVVLVLIS